MSDATWVITTFIFLFTTVISLLLTAGFWTFMHDEGRFFFGGNFDKKGIDVIRHEPLSNRLRLIRIKWNGQWFQYKKEMIFFGIETLINPKTDPQKYFNEVVSRMCTWADSKRPVLLVTDIMSHVITPDLLALVAKVKKHDNYVKAEKQKQGILARIRGEQPETDEDPTTVTYFETMKPDDLTSFMEDISARDGFQVYETGKRVNELERAKGFELGGTAKLVISMAGIALIGVVIYLVATGQLQEIFQTVTN